MHNAIGPLRGSDIINAIDYRIGGLREDLAKYSDSSIDFLRITAITEQIVEAYTVRKSILHDSFYAAMPSIQPSPGFAFDSLLVPSIVNVAERLVNRYVCNYGTDQEFIACITPDRDTIGQGGVWDDWLMLKVLVDQSTGRRSGGKS